MNLRELQAQFESALRGGEKRGMLDQILPAGTLSGPEALDVYGKSYRARLTSALGEIFETVWEAVGDEVFFSTAEAYIAAHPSLTHSLQFYGEKFPDFLARQSFPEFLAHLARFEWLFADLFHRPARTGLDGPALAQAVESGRRLGLVESAFLFESPWAVDAVFESRGTDHRPDIERPARFLAYKAGERIEIEKLGKGAFTILTKIDAGQPALQVLEQSEADEAEVEALFAFIALRKLLQ